MAVISPVRSFHRFGFNFLSLFCVLLLQTATGRKLKFVLLIMQHGDRSPLGTYPNDPYKEDIWPDGYGQLTTYGMQRQYELGEFLRNRYRHFLSYEYHQKEIYVRSTDMDRTIMSAQANLAGLFPPAGSRIWHKDIQWQPIPVHMVPLKDEKLLKFPLLNCTRFHKLLKETLKSEKVARRVKSIMKFLAQVAGYSGYDVKTLTDFTSDKLWNLHDALQVQSDNKYQLPQWATPDIMEKLRKTLVFGITTLLGRHNKRQKSRLQGGVLLKDILEKITKAARNTSDAKIVMYSAHDTTIIALQMALNVFQKLIPHYAACYFFELYQEENGKHSIEMYFRNDHKLDRLPSVTLPGCTVACQVERFQKLVAPIIPNNWEKECEQ